MIHSKFILATVGVAFIVAIGFFIQQTGGEASVGTITVSQSTVEAHTEEIQESMAPIAESAPPAEVAVATSAPVVKGEEGLPEPKSESVPPVTNTPPRLLEAKAVTPIRLIEEKPVATKPAPTHSEFNIDKMLAEHNAVRKEAGVPPLTWSNSLAADAQKWSETLKGDGCAMRHAPNLQHGENIYWEWTTAVDGENLISNPTDVVTAWAAEEKFYNYAENSCKPGEQCGHYTQLVWETTTQVGCGVSMCVEDRKQTDVWVCRYDPYGNIIGLKPF